MISRRKTIGTLCDAVRAQGKTREKAIRSLISTPVTKNRSKPSAFKKVSTISKAAASEDNLSFFARRAKQAAKSVPISQRFGDDLVYIYDAWKHMKSGSLAEFKEKLKRAYHQDHIDLAKSDMPQALPQKLLQKSLVKGRTVDFVFIKI